MAKLSAGLYLASVGAFLAGCSSGGGSGAGGIVPPPPAPGITSLRDVLPDSGAAVEPGILLSTAPGAEDGIGGARTTALNQAYHEANLKEAGADTVLTLNRRPPAAGPETIATFHGFTAGSGALTDVQVARTTDITRGGPAFADGAGLLLDGSRTEAFEFMTFAYWAIINTASDTIITAAGGSLGTPAADLSAGPGLGTATYRGTTLGGIVDGATSGDFRVLRGDIRLDANFGTGLLDAAITGTRLANPDTGADLGAGPTFQFTGATIVDAGGAASPGFQGSTGIGAFTATMNGAALNAGTGSFADLAGGFYGNQLEEVGGGWYVVTPTEEISGSFGAVR
jgi:hypothetical protein